MTSLLNILHSRTLRSHTHLQATQDDIQTKAYKRVCLPNSTDRQESTGGNTAPTQKAGFRVPKTVLWLIKH